MAVVGRPNVGKSTLVNRLLGDDRVVVYDQPGTTRDSIYIDYERRGQQYTLIDTAGVRRRKNVREMVEKFSIVKTLKAIADAHVVILLMDAHEGIVEQDLHLLGQCIEAGRGLVIALNKWDGIESDERDWIRTELNRRLQFVDYADIHFISALHGTGVGHLYNSVHRAHAAATASLSTPRLTRILEDAVAAHPPPMVNGRRVKLRYAHAGGQNPPLVVIHGSQTDQLPQSYVRYLEKTFRQALDLFGTPVRIELRTGDNPYAGKRNKLTQRQVQRRRRLVSHIKKAEKKKKNNKTR
jgi:ribosome-associated GTPase EngA